MEQIYENLVTLISNISNKRGYKIEILNNDAINSDDEVTRVVIKVINGNVAKLIEHITKIYNYTAEANGNKVMFIKN